MRRFRLSAYQNPSSQCPRRASFGECVESYLGGCMLSLSQSRAKGRTLKSLSIKIDSGFKPRCVIRSFSDACIGWQVKAAPLSQLLQLVLMHAYTYGKYTYEATGVNFTKFKEDIDSVIDEDLMFGIIRTSSKPLETFSFSNLAKSYQVSIIEPQFRC